MTSSDSVQAAAARARQRKTPEGLDSDDDYHNPTCDGVDNAILADAQEQLRIATKEPA